MNAEAMIRQHTEWMEARKLSRNTIRSRRYILCRLARWAEDNGSTLLTVTEADLARWQATRARSLSASAMRTETIHIQEAFKWAASPVARLVDVDPTRDMAKPRPQRRLPRPLSERDFRALLAAADDQLKAILGLSGFAGLRAAEIAGLMWSDVDTVGGALRVIGKGDKERVVPISEALAGILGRQQVKSGPVIKRRDGHSGMTTGNLVSMRAGAYGRSLGIEFRLHQLRHRFATVALEGTGNIRVVQELLGHESITATAIYTRVRQGSLRDAVAIAGQVGGAS